MIVDQGEDYEPIPAGLQNAACVNVFDVGWQRGYQGKTQRKCVILWELDKRKQDGSRFTVTKLYTASIAEKSNLRADLESWRGVKFTPAELKGFELDKLKSIPCALNLVEDTRNGKRVVNVAAITRIQRGIATMKIETSPDFIPTWVQRMIEKQLPPPEDAQDSLPRTQATEDDFNDDIPF